MDSRNDCAGISLETSQTNRTDDLRSLWVSSKVSGFVRQESKVIDATYERIKPEVKSKEMEKYSGK